MTSNKSKHKEVYGGPEYERRLRVYMRAYNVPRSCAYSLDSHKRSGQRKANGCTKHEKGCYKSGVSITYKDPNATVEVAANDAVYISRIVVHNGKSAEVTSQVMVDEPLQSRSKVTRTSRRSSRAGSSSGTSKTSPTVYSQDSGFEDTESDTTTEEHSSASCNSSLDAGKSSSESSAFSSPDSDTDGMTFKASTGKTPKRKGVMKNSRVSFCEQVRVANFFTDELSDESDSETDSLEGQAQGKEWRESIIEHNEVLKTDSFCVTVQRSTVVTDARPDNDNTESPPESDEEEEDDEIAVAEVPETKSARPSSVKNQLPSYIPVEARQRVVLTAPFTLIFNVSQVHKTTTPRISARLTPIHTNSKEEARKQMKLKQGSVAGSSSNHQLFRWPSWEAKDRSSKEGFWKEERRPSLPCTIPSSQDILAKSHRPARRWSTQSTNAYSYQPC